MTALERFVYACALAFWRAYFEAQFAARLAFEENPTDADRDRVRRFGDAIRRVHNSARGSGPDDPAPPVTGRDGHGMGSRT